MQVVDDNIYICKYIEYLSENRENIIKNIKYIPNQGIIYSAISGNTGFIEQIINAYESIVKWNIIEAFLKQFFEVEQIISRKEFQEISDEKRKHYIGRSFLIKCGNAFFMKIYVRNKDYSNILAELSENELENLMLKCKISKKTRERYAKIYLKFKALEEEKQKILQELILHNPYKF